MALMAPAAAPTLPRRSPRRRQAHLRARVVPPVLCSPSPQRRTVAVGARPRKASDRARRRQERPLAGRRQTLPALAPPLLQRWALLLRAALMLPLLAATFAAARSGSERQTLLVLAALWALATGLAGGAVWRGRLTRNRVTILSVLDFVLVLTVSVVAQPGVLIALPAYSLLSYLQTLLWGRRGALLAAALSLLAAVPVTFLRAWQQQTPAADLLLIGLWAFQNTLAALLLGIYAERQGGIVRDVWRQANRDRELAVRDPLTGLHNRRFLDQRLSEEIARARRTNRPLSVAVVDVDYLKKWNDTFGHAAGDAAIKTLADFLRGSCRTQDVVCRVGGEEFVVVAPDTDTPGLFVLLDRIRATVPPVRPDEKSDVLPRSLTFSAGVAGFTPGMTAAALIEAADAALYQAKNNGRNQVHAADDARRDV